MSEDLNKKAVKTVEAGETQIPDLGDFPIDETILATFPAGTQILSANQHGLSQWTNTARLHVQFPDGQETQYFLKQAKGEVGRRLMEGEFHAISAIHSVDNDFAPKPHAWGECSTGTDTETSYYFFLMQYIDMSHHLPDPIQLCRKLAQLHRNSVSPTGKFGFHVDTCQGKTQQSLGWESSWATLYAKMLKHVTHEDNCTNDHWNALEQLESRILSHVIPRLLAPLQTANRSIKPCLIHGDLWEGNTGTALETGNIYIFDAAAFYAHNELEIGDWRCFYNKIHDEVYTSTYLENYPPSEPKEEWEDRNRLYSIYYNVLYSVNHGSQGMAIRQVAFDDMYHLIDKFAPFGAGEGPPRLDPSQRVEFPVEADHTITEFGSVESAAYAKKMREGVGS
ncbi:MAG: hypothetical protein Q9168_005232 [Polycauliona sp. 1 TL-2023]